MMCRGDENYGEKSSREGVGPGLGHGVALWEEALLRWVLIHSIQFS